MKKKSLCYVSTHGFSLRMISQTNLLGKLSYDFDISLILNKDPGFEFKEYLNKYGIKLFYLDDKKNYNEYNFAKKYFINGFSKNIALLEKHKRSLKIKSKNPWKIVRPYFYMLLSSASKYLPFIISLFNYLERNILNDKYYRTLITKISPDLLISTYPVDIQESKLIHNSKVLNIPTLTHLLSWDNITAKGKFASLSDKFFVWGGVMEDELIELYNVKKNNIVKCGVPHFDIHNEKVTNEELTSFMNGLNLNPKKPYLIFGMSSPYFAPYEIEIVEWISKYLEKKNESELQFIIRPHPQNVKGYLSDQSWLPRLKKLDKFSKTAVFFPDLAEGNIPWQMKNNDMKKLSIAIHGSSAVLNTCSTFSIDGMLKKKPIIMTPFDADRHINYWFSARKQLDIIHIKKFIRITKPNVTKSFADLENIINNIPEKSYSTEDIIYYNYGYNKNSTDETVSNIKYLLNI